jgi:antibiotic biosynthesis monooxygenase (ABM) superfamily enzyme
MLGVYPIITSLAYLIFPLTPDWPIFARTLVLVPLMVLAVVYFVTPTIHRLAGPWLHPPVYTPVLKSEMVPEPLQEPVHS